MTQVLPPKHEDDSPLGQSAQTPLWQKAPPQLMGPDKPAGGSITWRRAGQLALRSLTQLTAEQSGPEEESGVKFRLTLIGLLNDDTLLTSKLAAPFPESAAELAVISNREAGFPAPAFTELPSQMPWHWYNPLPQSPVLHTFPAGKPQNCAEPAAAQTEFAASALQTLLVPLGLQSITHFPPTQT
jgi:hypothetical protein